MPGSCHAWDEKCERLVGFHREAKMASRFEHESVCTIYDAGLENGTPYIAMQYVEGETLAERIAVGSPSAPPSSTWTALEHPIGEAGVSAHPTETTRVGAPSREEIIEGTYILEQAARALHSAHSHGIVHGDLKPANIMIKPNGEPVLLDFGLAHDLKQSPSRLLVSGIVCGTPAYMSPEQCVADMSVDHRSDIWSLGVVLFEVATHKRPFTRVSREEGVRAILTTPIPDLCRINPSAPRELETVVKIATGKNPKHRYQTAQALAQDLRRVAIGAPVLG
jgi:serine/threonine protein kinase